MDDHSLFRNIDRLEESQSHISALLDRLDKTSQQEGAADVGNILAGMENLIGQFSDNHYNLYHEIQDLLENSRQDAYNHGKLEELIKSEQIRGKYLVNIVGSLKVQIESLFNTINVAVEESESDGGGDGGSVMEKVTDNVNLLWKSVESLSQLMTSPAKKVQYNIQKIDSEVIVHLNRLHLNGDGSEMKKDMNFGEKLESQARYLRDKRHETRSPKQQKSFRVSTASEATQTEMKYFPFVADSSAANNTEGSYSDAQYDNRARSPSNLKRSKSVVNVNRMPPYDNHHNNPTAPPMSFEIVGSSVSPQVRNNSWNNKNDDVFQSGTSFSTNLSSNSSLQSESSANLVSHPPNIMADSKAPVGNNNNGIVASRASNKVDASTKKSTNQSTTSNQQPLSASSSINDSFSVTDSIQSSLGPEPSTARVSASSRNLPKVEETTKKSSGRHGNQKSSTSTKTSHHSRKKSMISEDNSLKGDIDDLWPNERRELLDAIAKKEEELLQRSIAIEEEVKLKVKEYIKSHGLGVLSTAGRRQSTVTGLTADIGSPQKTDFNTVSDATAAVSQPHDATKVGYAVLNGSNAQPQHHQDDKTSSHAGQLNDLETDMNEQEEAKFKELQQYKNQNSAVGSKPNSAAKRPSHLPPPIATPPLPVGLSPPHSSHFPSSAMGRSQSSKHGTVGMHPFGSASNKMFPYPGKFPDLHSGGGSKPNSSYGFSGDLIKITALNSTVTQEQGTSTDDLESDMNKKELLIYNNQQNILITRSYKVTPELQTFQEQLSKAENPLYFLFQEFQQYLNGMQKERLLQASWMYSYKLNKTPGGGTESTKNTAVSIKTSNKDNNIIASGKQSSKNQSTDDANTNTEAKNNAAMIAMKVQPWVQMVDGLETTMKEIHSQSLQMIPLLQTIETIANDVIQVVKHIYPSKVPTLTIAGPVAENSSIASSSSSAHSHSQDYLRHSLRDLLKLFGDLQGKELVNNMKLTEFRHFFETIQSFHIRELTSMFQEFPKMKQCYDYFVETQGRLLEIHRRMSECKQRCDRYGLMSIIPSTVSGSYNMSPSPLPTSRGVGQLLGMNNDAPQPPPQLTYSHTEPRLELPSSQPPPALAPTDPPFSAMSIPMVQPGEMIMNDDWFNTPASQSVIFEGGNTSSANECIQDLQRQLRSAEQEIEDLELEMLDVVKERDKTPGAILFFSLMHEPSFVSNLQQLTLQFQSIRKFLNYDTEMDFITLRKRLQVCLVLMPGIEKLLDKYSQLYQRWSHYRLNWFAERNVRGSTADGISACPLCYNDTRESDNADKRNGLQVLGNGKDRKKENALLKKRRQVLNA